MRMRSLLILLVVYSAPALADEKLYTLTLTPAQIGVLGQAMDEAPLPYKITSPVINAIRAQIAAQNAPPTKSEEKPPAPEEKKE